MWCLANPDFLFKNKYVEIPDEELLERAFKDREAIEVAEIHNFDTLHLSYYKKVCKKRSEEIQICYKKYLAELLTLVRCVGNKWNGSGCYCNISEGFLLSETIKTDKSQKQLRAAFDVISKKFNCCTYTDLNTKIFMSMFDTSLVSVSGTIEWTDISTERTRQPSIASLYTLFKSLGVDMSTQVKEIICKRFTWKNGMSIEPDALKHRNTTKQKNIEIAIKEAIGN